MDVDNILTLVKYRLGISTDKRDTYLTAIINGLISELEGEQGITLVSTDMSQTMFIVDYAVWRYQARDSTGALPRHLQFRLNNLIIHSREVSE